MLFSVNEEVALEEVDSTIIKLCKYIKEIIRNKSAEDSAVAENTTALAKLIEARAKFSSGS